jgi:hypothetical protein
MAYVGKGPGGRVRSRISRRVRETSELERIRINPATGLPEIVSGVTVYPRTFRTGRIQPEFPGKLPGEGPRPEDRDREKRLLPKKPFELKKAKR